MTGNNWEEKKVDPNGAGNGEYGVIPLEETELREAAPPTKPVPDKYPLLHDKEPPTMRFICEGLPHEEPMEYEVSEVEPATAAPPATMEDHEVQEPKDQKL